MNELKEKLSAPLPCEAIKPHPTKTYLSSIKAIYVTERFNDVFGIGKWSVKVSPEHVNHETGMVVVKVIFEVKALDIYYESFGGNDNGGTNSKNFDLGDAYKGASTDAITKIGSYLGVGIDVFKGKSTPPKNDSNEEDNKPWLNIGDPAWVKGIEIKKPLKEVREFYKVSKANATEYEKQINGNN
jgi:hypothetical protein